MQFSKYQQDIFDFVEHETGSAVVTAVAGSGKTTTIVECARRIPESLDVTFLAFNKAIAVELNLRLPPHARAQTLNSLGFRALIRYLDTRGRIKLDGRKTQAIMHEKMTPDQTKLYASGLRKLVSLAKAHGLVPRGYPGTALLLDTEQNWVDLIDKYDVEFEKNADPLQGIEYARQILLESIVQGEKLVDFDDQLYLPVIWQATFLQHDVLFVDEAQDINAVQRAILRMALKPAGRLIAVGDARQAIYGFRGADTAAIANIREEFAAKELPLSISYRCPQAVVREAQQFVSHILPSDTAPQGTVKTLDGFGPGAFGSTDAVLCRNTAPLINLAFCLIRAGKPCKVLGREIGQGLVRLIMKMDAKTIDDLELTLAQYEERELAKLNAKGKEEQAAALEDRIDTIEIFIARLSEGKRTVSNLCEDIGQMFADKNSESLTLATVHKAKGLEWDRVFILDRWLMPSKWARQSWQKQQETNITYVAITRARRGLYYIDSRNWGQ